MNHINPRKISRMSILYLHFIKFITKETNKKEHYEFLKYTTPYLFSKPKQCGICYLSLLIFKSVECLNNIHQRDFQTELNNE